MKKLTVFSIMLSALLSVFASAAMAKDNILLDQVHFDKKIKCASCHGTTEPREAVKMVQCIKCHNTKKLAAATKNLKPTNPHDNRHFGTETDCSNCHHVHQKSENYCEGCHQRFDFIVP